MYKTTKILTISYILIYSHAKSWKSSEKNAFKKKEIYKQKGTHTHTGKKIFYRITQRQANTNGHMYTNTKQHRDTHM